MSSNSYPSQTSGIPTLAGALNPQTVDAEQVPMPTYETALAPAPAAPARPDPMAALSQLQAGMVQGRQEQNPPFQSITMKADGTFKMEGSQSMLADVMGQLKDLQTMKSAAMARVAQLRQQEASGSPLIDALSQFAGNMAANDPTMPGWVRALGATNLAMGPQGIKRERMAEEQKAMGLSKAIADTALDAAKFEQSISNVAQTNMLKAAEITRKMLDDQKTDNKDFSKLMGRVSTEVRSLRQFDPDTFAMEAKALGITDEQVVAAQDKFTSLASMAEQKYQLEQKAKNEQFSKEEQAKLNRQAISIGAAMERVLKSKDVSAIGAAQKLDMKEEAFLSSARTYDEYIKQAEATIAKYKDVMGPIAGRISRMNPYRRKEAQEAMAVISTNLQRFMQSQGESIARGSDRDMKLFERAAADINMTPEQALEQIKQQRIALEQKYKGVVEVNPYADWMGRYSVVVPEWAKPIVGDVLSRASLGPGMALPSGARAGGAKPPDLPKDFLDFLGSLPAGKGAKGPDGKKYILRDGVPVEVP